MGKIKIDPSLEGKKTIQRDEALPKVASGVSTLETLKRSGHKYAKFLGDLEHYDATGVQYKDKHFKEKWKSRWASESAVGVWKSRGYEFVDKAETESINAPGGETSWGPEGTDARVSNRGLVLMKCPKELYDLRQTIKREEQDKQNKFAGEDLRAEMHSQGVVGNRQIGKALPADDPFIKRLENGQ
jgi:hypothetical protein